LKTALRRIGNSAGVLIPKPFLLEVGLRAGDPVDLRVRKGRIYIQPVREKRRSQRQERDGPVGPSGGTEAAPDKAAG